MALRSRLDRDAFAAAWVDPAPLDEAVTDAVAFVAGTPGRPRAAGRWVGRPQ